MSWRKFQIPPAVPWFAPCVAWAAGWPSPTWHSFGPEQWVSGRRNKKRTREGIFSPPATSDKRHLRAAADPADSSRARVGQRSTGSTSKLAAEWPSAPRGAPNCVHRARIRRPLRRSRVAMGLAPFARRRTWNRPRPRAASAIATSHTTAPRPGCAARIVRLLTGPQPATRMRVALIPKVSTGNSPASYGRIPPLHWLPFARSLDARSAGPAFGHFWHMSSERLPCTMNLAVQSQVVARSAVGFRVASTVFPRREVDHGPLGSLTTTISSSRPRRPNRAYHNVPDLTDKAKGVHTDVKQSRRSSRSSSYFRALRLPCAANHARKKGIEKL